MCRRMATALHTDRQPQLLLGRYAKKEGYESRSAVVHKAVRLLRASGLGAAYEEAWREWAASGEEEELWGSTSADGLPS
jgi:Arc/MetJ-type ribon-helix-helix transcriptional regulator